MINLSDDASTEQVADCITSKHGKLDVLVNNLFGTAATTEAFQPPLAKEATSAALFVFVSSYTKSLSLQSDMPSKI